MAVLSKPLPPGTVIGNLGRRKITPPIPLERPSKKELQKTDYQTYKLRSTPTQNNSPTYELIVPYFATGTCEEFLVFQKNVNKVIVGQNVTTAANKFALVRGLLQGDSLTTFNNMATSLGAVNNATFDACMAAVAQAVFPARAVLVQKRYLRRIVRKPFGMRTRDYVVLLKSTSICPCSRL